MKLMTWNIWGGKHLDDVIQLLENEKPDVIGLQEVKEQNGENHAKVIAEKLGYSYQYCKSFTTDRHTPVFDLGNAILSKVPFQNPICHFLSTMDQYERSSKTEPRTVVEVEIEHNGKTLTILSTHLGFSEGFGDSELRDYQVNNLLPLTTDRHCVLMGDFNSLPGSKTIHHIEQHLQNADTIAEEPSITDMKDPNRTQYRIDYIFGDKTLEFKNFRILPTEASDHRPLVVEI